MTHLVSPPMGLPPPPAGVTPPSLYMLQWHEHHASFFRLMEELCQSQSMTDVTVACGDVSLEAHSIILSASSPLLRSILAKAEGKKQTIHFMDMNPFHMQLLLQYMYRGEISVPQSDLGPLMQSAKALQIKGLSGGNSEEKISEFASYLAQQQQQQQQQQLQHQLQQYQPQPQQQQPLPLIQTPMLPTQQPQQMATPFGTPVTLTTKRNSVDEVSVSRMTSSGGKKRRSKNPEEQTELPGEKKIGLDYAAVSPDGGFELENKLMVKPRKTSRQGRRRTTNGGQLFETQHEHDDGTFVKLEATDQPVSSNGEIGSVLDDDAAGFDGESFPSGSVTENWSDQLTMKVKGHRIPVLPKPLSQMKTTETRSYLSRLIWATNGWKRPQYGNPETKPIWWPDELLKWSEMKKMGGKKADGLSNVNYNEVQKNILSEGYRFFGFDPETLCYIGTKEEKERLEEERMTSSVTSAMTSSPAAMTTTMTVPTTVNAVNIGSGGIVSTEIITSPVVQQQQHQQQQQQQQQQQTIPTVPMPPYLSS